jgi:hypothetical protein
MFLKSRLVQSLPRGTHVEVEQGSAAVEEGKRTNSSEVKSTGHRP